MNKKNYLGFDTETLGGAFNANCPIYDCGFIKHDRQGNVLDHKHILVKENFDKIDEAYYKKNKHIYYELIEKGLVEFVNTEAELIDYLINYIKENDIDYLTAFNTSFDFVKTSLRELLNYAEFIDIMQMAVELLKNTTRYTAFCDNNDFKTKNGQNKCNVETICRFIYEDEFYEEEHTALADTVDELAIFVYLMNKHKSFTKNKHAIMPR